MSCGVCPHHPASECCQSPLRAADDIHGAWAGADVVNFWTNVGFLPTYLQHRQLRPTLARYESMPCMQLLGIAPRFASPCQLALEKQAVMQCFRWSPRERSLCCHQASRLMRHADLRSARQQ